MRAPRVHLLVELHGGPNLDERLADAAADRDRKAVFVGLDPGSGEGGGALAAFEELRGGATIEYAAHQADRTVLLAS